MAETEVRVRTLRQHRQARLLSQRDLVKLAGVSTRTLVAVERGQTPSYATVRKLCRALDLRPEEVAEFKEALSL